MTENHTEYPILSVLFTGLSFGFLKMKSVLLFIDFKSLDEAIIAPASHIASSCSAMVAITLGLLSIYERYLKKKS